MADTLLLPGGVVSLSAQAADRLLDAGNGDAALLYLCLLRSGDRLDLSAAARRLKWDPLRAQAAHAALAALSLADPAARTSAPTPAEPDEPPEYTGADIAKELSDGASPFPGLVREVERRLGKVLSTADLKLLYTLYDYLALPAEVILLLVNWCCEETGRKYGAGRKPRMSQIRKEGFVWRRLGVDTVEAAEAHLKRQTALRDRESVLLPLLGITGRCAVEAERKYLSAWLDMGFPEEAIALAYERTVLKKQGMNWAYMNSILRSWHQKGLHTPAQIQAGDSAHPKVQRVPAQPGAGQATGRERDDIRWMDRFLASQREEREKEDGHHGI